MIDSSLRVVASCPSSVAAELSHHLKSEPLEPREADHTSQTRSNSRNGYSSKTVQFQQGAMELAIPHDRNRFIWLHRKAIALFFSPKSYTKT
jgi:transposase-like protein